VLLFLAQFVSTSSVTDLNGKFCAVCVAVRVAMCFAVFVAVCVIECADVCFACVL